MVTAGQKSRCLLDILEVWHVHDNWDFALEFKNILKTYLSLKIIIVPSFKYAMQQKNDAWYCNTHSALGYIINMIKTGIQYSSRQPCI